MCELEGERRDDLAEAAREGAEAMLAAGLDWKAEQASVEWQRFLFECWWVSRHPDYWSPRLNAPSPIPFEAMVEAYDHEHPGDVDAGDIPAALQLFAEARAKYRPLLESRESIPEGPESKEDGNEVTAERAVDFEPAGGDGKSPKPVEEKGEYTVQHIADAADMSPKTLADGRKRYRDILGDPVTEGSGSRAAKYSKAQADKVLRAVGKPEIE